MKTTVFAQGATRKIALFIFFCFPISGLFSQPQISAFTPQSGPVGTTVTMSGNGFNTTAANNIVYFGPVKAQVSTATSTSLTVTVPAGAGFQPITVTNNGLTGYSTKPFIVTFPGSGFSSQSFDVNHNYGIGEWPENSSIGDIDGDGKPDIVIANFSSKTVSVFRNLSTPGVLSLSPKVDYTTLSEPNFVSLADINGDGRLDLLIANIGGTVSVLVNTSTVGTISFAPTVDYMAGNSPSGVAVGDLNGDGRPDIVVTNFGTTTVSVFKNTTSGGIVSFAAKTDFTVGSAPKMAWIEDLNGDGQPDLAVANYSSNTVSVLKNTSSGGLISFSPKVDYAAGSAPIGVCVADFDNDGKPDLAVAHNSGTSPVSVLQNSSSGGMISFAPKVDYISGNSGGNICVTDLDGDGKPDLAAGNYGAQTVSVFKNTSTPGTVSFSPKVDFLTDGNTRNVSASDIDLDGKPDILLTNKVVNTLSILRNRINEPVVPCADSLTASVSVNDVPCGGSTGSAIIVASGYTTKQYSLDSVNFQVGNTFYGLAPGNYRAFVKYAGGCILSANFTVQQAPNTLNGTIQTTNIPCSGTPGSATITATGGIPPYSYKLNTQAYYQASNTFSNLAAGSYSITIKDTMECTKSLAFTITQATYPDTPVVSASGPLNICNGSSITLTSSQAANYQWYKDGAPIPGAALQSYTVTQSGNYRIYTTNSCGNNASKPVTVSVSTTPVILTTPVIQALSDTTFCQGSNVWLRIRKEQGVRYQWFKDGQPASAGGLSDTTYIATTTGNYAVHAYNTCNGDSVISRSVAVNVIPNVWPRITTSGPLSFCNGGSITLTSTPASSYQWYKNWQLIPGATSQSYIATQSGYYYNVVTNTCGNVYDSVLVSVKPGIPNGFTPQIYSYGSYNGDSSFCEGGMVHLYTWSQSGMSYKWFRNGVMIPGATDTSYDVTSPGLYSVGIYASCNQDSAVSRSITISAEPLPAKPVITANGPLSFCSGDSVVLTSSASSGNIWYSNGSKLTWANQASFVPSWSGVFRVAVTNGCGTSMSDSVQVEVANSPAKVSIYRIYAMGDTTFCNGGKVTLNAGWNPGVTFKWFKDGSLITGATDSLYTATQSGYYSVRVISNCSGDSSTSRQIRVTVNSLTAPVITTGSPLQFCSGDSVVLTSSASSGNQWYLNSTLLSGATGRTFTARSGGAYQVFVTSTCGKVGSDSAVVRVASGPAKVTTPYIYATGDTSFCSGNNVLLKAFTGQIVSYQWLHNGLVIPGATDSSVRIWDKGTYSLRAYSACSGDSATSRTIMVNVLSYPDTPRVMVNGPLSLCHGDSVTLTSSPAANYQWYRDGQLIPGARSQSYTAKVSGSYRIYTANNCGNNASNPVQVSVSATPALLTTPAILFTGDTTFCHGKSVLLYTTSRSGVNYKWFKNGTAISGATDTAYIATTSGSYAVKLYNTCNNDSVVSRLLTITTLTYPDTPALTASGPLTLCTGSGVTLTSSLAANYEWYRDGVQIQGATSRSYTVTQPGSYRVYTSGRCGTSASNPASITLGTTPSLGLVTPTPSTLWSPNHEMVDITLDYGTTNACATASCNLSVSSNEPQNGLGDGDMDNDWEIIDNYRIRLRAERSGKGEGRVYTIKIECTDSTGNSITRYARVTVPKSTFNLIVLQNPSNTDFRFLISTTDNSPITIRVYKLSGDLIETIKNVLPNSTLSLGNNYQPGMYYIEFSQGNKRRTATVVKL